MKEKGSDIIVINNLSFAYESGNPVLENVSLNFRELETACIVGPNGGGKSTLLYLILGLIRPTGGQIKWDWGGVGACPSLLSPIKFFVLMIVL